MDNKQAIQGFTEFFKGITGNQNLEIPSEIAEKCGIQAQADVLDKIRAEIVDMPKLYPFIDHIDTYVKVDDVLTIIDKYKAESEVQE